MKRHRPYSAEGLAKFWVDPIGLHSRCLFSRWSTFEIGNSLIRATARRRRRGQESKSLDWTIFLPV